MPENWGYLPKPPQSTNKTFEKPAYIIATLFLFAIILYHIFMSNTSRSLDPSTTTTTTTTTTNRNDPNFSLLPLPFRSSPSNDPKNIKVSVIISAFNRPHNIKDNLLNLLTIPQIDDIKVYYGNSRYMKSSYLRRCPKAPYIRHIKDWELNSKYLTFRKFMHAEEMKNDCILILDDDLR